MQVFPGCQTVRAVLRLCTVNPEFFVALVTGVNTFSGNLYIVMAHVGFRVSSLVDRTRIMVEDERIDILYLGYSSVLFSVVGLTANRAGKFVTVSFPGFDFEIGFTGVVWTFPSDHPLGVCFELVSC